MAMIPWLTVAEVRALKACCDECNISDETITDGIATATSILYMLSGYRFGCRQTVIRPNICHSSCSCSWDYWNDSVAYVGGGCTCPWAEGIVLDGGVQSVDSVKVDNVIVAASNYRLYDKRRLVRTDGSGWPCCQHLRNNGNDPNVPVKFEVVYTFGLLPDAAAKRAAAQYACQLALSAAGSPACKLPDRIQTVSRQGVTMAILDPLSFVNKGQTGLTQVDIWLKSVNPYSIRRPAKVYSPDTMMHSKIG